MRWLLELEPRSWTNVRPPKFAVLGFEDTLNLPEQSSLNINLIGHGLGFRVWGFGFGVEGFRGSGF